MAVQISLAQTSFPENFDVSTVATGLTEPLAIAFAPDGRMFIAEKGGAIRIVENNVLQPETFAQLEVYTVSESGLLGLAIDPDFEENGYVYAFATVSSGEQRVIRLTHQNGTAVDSRVIVDNLPTTGSNHNGGCLRVGPDRHLYFSIGDNEMPELSQQLTSLSGKVSRVRLDGSVPDDNPYATPTGAPRAVYASGFRNPFRFCFANDGRMFVMDVGSSGDERFEEINLATAGSNHGWPMDEGMSLDLTAGFVAPLVAYHNEGSSIAGCVVYEGEAFPAEYRGDLFHIDFVSQAIFRAQLSENQIADHSLFAQLEGGPVDLAVGPDGALYWTELYSGQVKRLAYSLAVAEVPDDGTDDGNESGVDTIPASTPCGPSTLSAMIFASGVMAFLLPLHPFRRPDLLRGTCARQR